MTVCKPHQQTRKFEAMRHIAGILLQEQYSGRGFVAIIIVSTAIVEDEPRVEFLFVTCLNPDIFELKPIFFGCRHIPGRSARDLWNVY